MLTVKVKTVDLIGPALDWAVVIALGVKPEDIYIGYDRSYRRVRDEEGELTNKYETGPEFLPSKMWESGGPILARKEIGVKRRAPCMKGEEWEASGSITAKGAGYGYAVGPTPLVAVMRCFVAGELGREVDVPKQLKKED